jgi:hypothetical protein
MVLTIDELIRFVDKVDKTEGGCHIWTGGTNGQGYGCFLVDGKIVGAHRVAWAIAHERWALGLVLHKCDTPLCVNPDHLYEGDNSQNMIDKSQRGPLHCKQKLTPDDVREIRRLLFLGCYTHQEISEQFGVDRSSIGKINTGKYWSHV